MVVVVGGWKGGLVLVLVLVGLGVGSLEQVCLERTCFLEGCRNLGLTGPTGPAGVAWIAGSMLTLQF